MRRGVVALVGCSLLVGVLISVSGASGATSSSVTISVPGPITGCSPLAQGTSDATLAIDDIILPSAFVTSTNDTVQGEGGAIASAELVSLNPETVVYAISPAMAWSNGVKFSATDLIDWWKAGRSSTSVTRVGYQDISSMVADKTGTSVTAVFSRPYAAWNQLFRDVGFHGSHSTCAPSSLTRMVTLGPYRIVSATASSVVLEANPHWTLSFNRIQRVTITTRSLLPARGQLYVAYEPQFSSSSVMSLTQHPLLTGAITSQNVIEEVQFAPHESSTKSVALRRAWSLLIDRHALIKDLFGTETLVPTPASSALFAQGEPGNPSTGMVAGVTGVTGATSATSVVADCVRCGEQWLASHGYRRINHWLTFKGKPVTLSVATGQSPVDRATTDAIRAQWRSLGVQTTLHQCASDVAASALAAAGGADVAIVERPTDINPVVPAESFLSSRSKSSFAVNTSISSMASLVSTALATFNPVTALTAWSMVDQAVAKSFIVRPLFTPPALVVWSTAVENVVPVNSLEALVDSVTNWGVAGQS